MEFIDMKRLYEPQMEETLMKLSESAGCAMASTLGSSMKHFNGVL